MSMALDYHSRRLPGVCNVCCDDEQVNVEATEGAIFVFTQLASEPHPPNGPARPGDILAEPDEVPTPSIKRTLCLRGPSGCLAP